MRKAHNLLYGRRKSYLDGHSYLLRDAERALRNGQVGPAVDYLFNYPDDLLNIAGVENLILAVASTDLRLPGDCYDSESVFIRPDLNDRAPSPDGSNEKRYISEQLHRWGKHGNREQAVREFAYGILENPEAGPLALQTLTYTGLDSKIKAFYRSGNKSGTIQEIGNYLRWRLLAEAEKPARNLSESLRLTDKYHPQIGELYGRLHYLAEDDYAACDRDLAIPRAERGSWRKHPDKRCPECLSLVERSPGSDDLDYYTLLDPEAYNNALRGIHAILKDLAGQALHYSGDQSEDDYLDELINKTNDRVANYAYRLAANHKQTIANLLTERFNNPNDHYRSAYLSALHDRSIIDRHNDLFYEQSEEKSIDPALLLDNDTVIDWLDNWMEPGQKPNVGFAAQELETKLQLWLIDAVGVAGNQPGPNR